MQFSSKQDDEGFGQPICAVMKCEEKKIEAMFCDFVVSRAQRDSNIDQYGNYDYRALAEQWNGEGIKQLRKPLAQRANMYPETAQLIMDFHKKVQQHRNQKKTF
jgi:hypothetical protein